MQKLGNILYY